MCLSTRLSLRVTFNEEGFHLSKSSSENNFGALYSSLYDELYAAKDYQAECNLVSSLLSKYAPSEGKHRTSILDLGCGTAGHAIPFAKMGFEVCGVDPSAGMLARAREKAEEEKVAIEFVHASSADFECGREFDACISMFAVFCYHQSNEEILQALRRIVRHLRVGGLFIMDFWFGPAVLSQKPETRARFFESEGTSFCRVVTPTLDVCSQTVATHYDVIELSASKPATITSETHVMRYFFLKELELYCSQVGLRVERFGVFPDFESQPTAESWNVMMVAKKVEEK